jgi:hypothetical protein
LGYSPETIRPSAIRGIISGKLGRRLVTQLFRAAFPDCVSEEQMADAAHEVLGIDKRHIRKLIDGEHSCSIDVALALICLTSFEATAAAIVKIIQK